MPTLEFFGLCGLGEIDSVFQASMPNVDDHNAVLFMAASDLVIMDSTTPDLIVHDRSGAQLVLWVLRKVQLRFDGAAGSPAFRDQERKLFLDLREFHSGEKMQASAAAATIALPKGDLTAGGTRESFDLSLGTTPLDPRSVATSAVWTGGFTKLLSADGKIKIALKDRAAVTLSNLAATPDGTGHFHHYYDQFFKTKPSKVITIKHHARAKGDERRNVDVFDCVPPAPLP